MAEVPIDIAGRRYDLYCRDGEEEQLRAIARLVDGKARDAAQSMGGLNEARQLLYAALLLADELHDARLAAGAPNGAAPAPKPAEDDAGMALAIERLAERMESIADRLEA